MKAITIDTIKIYPILLPLVEPLKTSFGVDPHKSCIVVEILTTDGMTGWGEASVDLYPGYGAETMGTGLHVLESFLVPLLQDKTIIDPTEVPAIIASVRGNHHTKAGLEAAVWDAFAKTNDMRLTDLFASYLPQDHASRNYAKVGVSIGIQPTVEDTNSIIQKRVNQGYERIKLKIQPGWDVELAADVRQTFPDITLMLDANSAYTLQDAEHLKKLDDFNLLMIEQPLGYDDIYEHSKLQPQLKTPICLDESIKSANDLRLAIDVGAIGILNLKPARVGGYTESLAIYRVCAENNLPLWIGGMLECGIGRATNVAFAALPAVNLPCDISATDRYFNPDITEPPFVLGTNSDIAVPDGVGIGVEVRRDRLEEATQRWKEENPYQ